MSTRFAVVKDFKRKEEKTAALAAALTAGQDGDGAGSSGSLSGALNASHGALVDREAFALSVGPHMAGERVVREEFTFHAVGREMGWRLGPSGIVEAVEPFSQAEGLRVSTA